VDGSIVRVVHRGNQHAFTTEGAIEYAWRYRRAHPDLAAAVRRAVRRARKNIRVRIVAAITAG
jgi:hypothetical protein